MYTHHTGVLRTLALASGVITLGLSLAACSSSSTAPSTSSSTTPTTSSSSSSTPATSTASKFTKTPPYRVELITKSNASPYWLAVKAGAEYEAKKLGNMSISFVAPASGTDLSTQISMVNSAVTAHVSGIILAAQQPQPLATPVQQALRAGIPVVTVDSGVSPAVSLSFDATSNIQAGEAIARYGAKLAGGKGEYGIIDFNEISSTGRQRPEGFKEGMKSFPGFNFVGMQIANNSIATGKAEAEAMITSHPGLNLIFGANDRAAIGAAEAVQALGKTKQIVVVGFDADLGEVPLIKSGVIRGSILQEPYTMGCDAAAELNQIFRGQSQSVPKRVRTGYLLVTPSNISTSQAQSFLAQYGAAARAVSIPCGSGV